MDSFENATFLSIDIWMTSHFIIQVAHCLFVFFTHLKTLLSCLLACLSVLGNLAVSSLSVNFLFPLTTYIKFLFKFFYFMLILSNIWTCFYLSFLGLIGILNVWIDVSSFWGNLLDIFLSLFFYYLAFTLFFSVLWTAVTNLHYTLPSSFYIFYMLIFSLCSFL